MRVKSNLWKIGAFQFLSLFLFYLPYIVKYFQDAGLSLTKIAILFGVYNFSIVLFEVPSGYIADRWGRKNSLVAYSILVIVGLYLLVSSNNFYIWIISHIIRALATSFASGTTSSLLYDTLLSLNRTDEFSKMRGKVGFASELGAFTSSLGAAYLVKFGIITTLYANFVPYILLVFVCLSFVEPTRHKKMEPLPFRKEVKRMGSIIKESLLHPSLFLIFIFLFIVQGFANTLFLLFQPYFIEVGLPLQWFGIVFSLIVLVTMFSVWNAHKVEKKISLKFSMPFLLVLTGSSYLLMSIFPFIWGISFIVFRELVRGYIFPVSEHYIHKIAKEDVRATVQSIGSLFSRLGFATIMLIAGVFIDSIGLLPTMFAMGIISLLFSAVFYGLFSRMTLRQEV